MRFDSNKLPKKALAWIVDQFRPAAISDQKFAKILWIDMQSGYYRMFLQCEKIDTQLNLKKLSGRSKKVLESRNKLIKQYNSLVDRAVAKRKLIEEIEQHFPELKDKELKSCKEK